MKHIASVLVVAVGLAFTVFAAETAKTPAAEDVSKPQISNERFDAKVLKVFSAKDGEAVFRAYQVKWKDQDVIVSDPLAKSDHKAGDTITVLAINLPYPNGHEGPRLLSFHTVPKP